MKFWDRLKYVLFGALPPEWKKCADCQYKGSFCWAPRHFDLGVSVAGNDLPPSALAMEQEFAKLFEEMGLDGEIEDAEIEEDRPDGGYLH